MSKNWNLNFKLFISGIFVLIASSCGKVKNSSSGDLDLYGSGISGSTQFLAARAVLAVHCFACHAGWANYNEQAYKDNFKVEAGNPNGSNLYTRIRGNDSGVSGDMPQNRPDLSYDDLKKIKDWIVSM